MGSSSYARRKGLNFENEIADDLRLSGLDITARRSLYSGADFMDGIGRPNESEYGDIKNSLGMCISAKCHGALKVNEWMKELAAMPTGNLKMLICQMKNKRTTTPKYVVMKFDDWLDRELQIRGKETHQQVDTSGLMFPRPPKTPKKAWRK